jgi:hypothetical protein
MANNFTDQEKLDASENHPVLKSTESGGIHVPHVNVDNLPANIPTQDNGPAWTSANGIAGVRFTSADQSGAFASVTSAPTSGQKLVITDIIISVDTAMRVDFAVESATGTVIESIYMAANSTVNVITRSKRKLATADKKLQIKTSASGNISVNAFYYSEA